MDFQLKDDKGDLGTYVLNGEWDLLGMFSAWVLCVAFNNLNYTLLFFFFMIDEHTILSYYFHQYFTYLDLIILSYTHPSWFWTKTGILWMFTYCYMTFNFIKKFLLFVLEKILHFARFISTLTLRYNMLDPVGLDASC